MTFGQTIRQVFSGRARWLLIALPIILLTQSSHTRQVLTHDAYVWQRQWRPAVADAMAQSTGLVRTWRVLAAHTDAGGRLRPVAVDWSAVARTGRPVVPVVRIEGQLAHWDADRLIDDLQALSAAWQARGVAITGLEIDHDCGTARLPDYAAFLARLRGLAPWPLSITALPTWMQSRDLDAVLAQVDEVVLQLHAVLNPRAGLFDAAAAGRWIDDFARRTPTPFRVALPNYGSRVSWNEDGRLRAVESEMPLLSGPDAGQELTVLPEQVAMLLRSLEQNPPSGLVGVTWFRLPVAGDRRAWSLATWRAVIRDELTPRSVTGLAVASDIPGMQHLFLANDGDIDLPLPRAVVLAPSCTLADGVNGYALERDGSRPVFRRAQAGLLRGHHRQLVGWMRCETDRMEIDVRP